MHLVFVGGGHSHVIALKKWGEKSIPKIQVTLISDVKQAPYSGTLPGFIAGYYSYEQTHIDLAKIAQFAQVNLIIDRVINIKADDRKIICHSGRIIEFDLLSIDIGSTPKTSMIEGANLYATPAKPVPCLLDKWQQIISNCQQHPHLPVNISIIGGGAGGIELSLNMHHRLTNILEPQKLTINVIDRGSRILSSHNLHASNQLTQILNHKKINIYLKTEIIQIISNQIKTKSCQNITSDYIFLVTGSQPAPWLAKTKISTNQKGFILIKDTLQTINYHNIFATGDIATMINYSHPKAGVFAVKQGRVLYQNICHYLNKKPLNSYQPQGKYLNIIGTGELTAVAIWGKISNESPWWWYIKKWLDFKFMNQFTF